MDPFGMPHISRTIGIGKKGRYYHSGPPPPPPMMPQPFGFEDEDPSEYSSFISGYVEESANYNVVERQKKTLTDFHLLLCAPTVRGFCLREQEWGMFSLLK
jgi:hypothetical protein